MEELYSTGLPDQNQQVSIVVVSAMLAVRWLEANAGTSEQETAVPTPEHLSNLKMNRNLDLLRTTCKVLRIPKAMLQTEAVRAGELGDGPQLRGNVGEGSRRQ